MRYCPYCGADLPDGAFSFCPVCGNPLSGAERRPAQEKTKSRNPKAGPRKRKKKRSRRAGRANDRPVRSDGNAADEDYDGYYDDVRPSDEGEIRQGLDKNMIKRIAGLIAGVIIAIAACVAIMYLL